MEWWLASGSEMMTLLSFSTSIARTGHSITTPSARMSIYLPPSRTESWLSQALSMSDLLFSRIPGQVPSTVSFAQLQKVRLSRHFPRQMSLSTSGNKCQDSEGWRVEQANVLLSYPFINSSCSGLAQDKSLGCTMCAVRNAAILQHTFLLSTSVIREAQHV